MRSPGPWHPLPSPPQGLQEYLPQLKAQEIDDLHTLRCSLRYLGAVIPNPMHRRLLTVQLGMPVP